MLGQLTDIFGGDSAIFCIAMLIFLLCLGINVTKYNTFFLKILEKSFDGCTEMFRWLFPIKIHAKCFQITHKVVSSYTEDNIKSTLSLDVSARENQVKFKNFHGAVQSNNAVFAGFNHVKPCRLSDGGCK